MLQTVICIVLLHTSTCVLVLFHRCFVAYRNMCCCVVADSNMCCCVVAESNAVEGKEDEVAEYLESVALAEIKEERKVAGKKDADREGNEGSVNLI